eukprot:1158010-Pelagomonas_calceolata.AAC.5
MQRDFHNGARQRRITVSKHADGGSSKGLRNKRGEDKQRRYIVHNDMQVRPPKRKLDWRDRQGTH